MHPYCTGDTRRTSPCHLNSPRSGMALKSYDWWLVDGCDVCHSILDGRMQNHDLTSEEILKCQFRALYYTLENRFERGLINHA